ncbi:hypothetical protein [Ruminococcus sp. Marseille-P6503]|uniref:hypothetical protein n=1 Tax=Ruminococcus sp. Marseille-P6503 TaxID=2364796 RepID=UPI000F549519|nr:hypothetical protein [Ruminococcus sp. Marseille-P6503]
MKQLRIFDKYTAPSEWKEAVLSSADTDNRKVYVKRRYINAAVCALALIIGGAAVFGRLNKGCDLSAGEPSDSVFNADEAVFDCESRGFAAEQSGEYYFRGIAAAVRDNQVTVYEEGKGLVSVSFADGCVFYDEDNNETDFDNFKTGDTLIVNYDGNRMETYPERINSCGILQRIGSLQEGEYITDLTGGYFIGEVCDVTEDGLVVKAYVNQAYYTVHVEIGYIYDENNGIISLDEVKAGKQIRVGYNGDINSEDTGDVYADIVQIADSFGDQYELDAQAEAEADFTVREVSAAGGSEIIFETAISDEDEKLLLNETVNDYMERITAADYGQNSVMMPVRTFMIIKESGGGEYKYFVADTQDNIFFSSDEGDIMISKDEEGAKALMELLYRKSEESVQDVPIKCKLAVSWQEPDGEKIVRELLENGSARFDSADGLASCLMELNIDREKNEVTASISYINKTEDALEFSGDDADIELYPADSDINVNALGQIFSLEPSQSLTVSEFTGNYEAGGSYVLRIDTGVAVFSVEFEG